MIRRPALRAAMTGLLAGALGACTLPDAAVERGTPPAIEASVLRRDVFVQLLDGPHLPHADRATLDRAVRLVALGRPGAVRASVTARAPEAETVREALMGLGLDPARIEASGGSDLPPLIAEVALTRFVAHTRECGAAIQPATDPGIDVASSLDSLGRCVQANNLARMLADPGDLLTSPPLGQQPGVVAGGAIGRARGQLGVSAFSPGIVGGTPSAAGPVAPTAAGAGPAGPL